MSVYNIVSLWLLFLQIDKSRSQCPFVIEFTLNILLLIDGFPLRQNKK